MQPIRKAVIGVAMVGSTLTGGAVGAMLLNGSASAADSTTSTTAADATAAPSTAAPSTATPAAPAKDPNFDPSKGGHMANGITEALLTGDAADKAKAAALAAVPGGTIQRVENDAEGATYEAHMTKADGSHVTVKMDASFKVTGIETGR
jgi:ABC-type transport system substrate-binding protein